MQPNTQQPDIPAPDDCSPRYARGWEYADRHLLMGGSYDAESPGGWHDEQYEGWWDRLDIARRTINSVG